MTLKSMLELAEHFNAVTLGKPAEYWEEKNDAMIKLAKSILEYTDAPSATIAEAFNAKFFRLLKDPIKQMISDLRSQQVKEACHLLSVLADITKDGMKLFLRDTYIFIFDAVKVPHKLMAGYVDESILIIIKSGTFKFFVPHLVLEICEHKSGKVREKYLEYINEIILHWELTEKETDNVCTAVLAGIQDSTQKSREIARIAYLNLFQKNQRKAEALIKERVSPNLQKTLAKAEKDYLLRTGDEAAGEQKPPPPEQKDAVGTGNVDSGSMLDSAMVNDPSASAAASDILTGAADTGGLELMSQDAGDALNLPVNSSVEAVVGLASPNGIALRRRRQSIEEAASEAIQAVVRGKLTRKSVASPAQKLRKSVVAPARKSPGLSPTIGSPRSPAGSNSSPTKGSSQKGSPLKPAASPTMETPGAVSSSSPVYNLLSPKNNSDLLAPVFSPEPPMQNRAVSPAAVASSDNSPAFTLSATPEPSAAAPPVSAPQSAIKGPGSGIKSTTGSASKVGSAAKTSGLRASNLPASASKASKGDGSDEEGSTVSKTSHRSVRSARSAATTASSTSRLASTMAAKPGSSSSRFLTGSSASRAATAAEPHSSATKARRAISSTPATKTATPAAAKSSPTTSAPAAASAAGHTPPVPPRAPPAPKPPSAAASTPSGATPAPATEDHFIRPPSSIYVGCRVSISQKALAGSSPTTPTAIGAMNDTADPAGIVRFIGFTSFAPGYWLGIELLTPTGKNNGSVHGVSYFKCMDNYGIFTRAKLVTALSSGHAGAIQSPSGPVGSAMTTPSRPSRPPSLSKEEPAYTPFATDGDNAWSEDQKLSSLLKIKIAKMMFLLNRQVEIAEELEHCWVPGKQSATGASPAGSVAGMGKYLKMREEIDEMVALENKCLKDFSSRLGALT